MLTNINTILTKFNINYYDLFNLHKPQVKNKIKKYNDELDWRSKLVEELLWMREYQCYSNLNLKEIN